MEVEHNRAGIEVQGGGIGIPVNCNAVCSIGCGSSERQCEKIDSSQSKRSRTRKNDAVTATGLMLVAWTKIFGVILDFSLFHSHNEFLRKFFKLYLQYLSDHFTSTIIPGLKHYVLPPDRCPLSHHNPFSTQQQSSHSES